MRRPPLVFRPFDAGPRPEGSRVTLGAVTASNGSMWRRYLLLVVIAGGLLALSLSRLWDVHADVTAWVRGFQRAPGFVGDIQLMVLLALATFASEDAACIGAGVLVTGGHLGFAEAVLGCGSGIFAGDLGLFFAGRLVGR